MNKIFDFALYCIYLIVVAILACIVCLIISGCQSANIVPVTETAHQTFTEIVHKTDWLVAIGLLATAFGVMTAINGGTKGAGIIGGGLTLTALVLTIARWGAWVTAAIAILAVVGLATFLFTAADVNNDGRIDLQDLKNLFKWR